MTRRSEVKKELKKYVDEIKVESREGRGRISNLTWELLLQIRALLYKGHYQKYIFGSLGIPKTTWDAWGSKGREIRRELQNPKIKKNYDKLKEIEKRYILLSGYIEVGKAKAVVRHLDIIDRAAKDDWKASKWYLEMLDRESFGTKVEAEIKHAFVTMEDLLEDAEEE